MANKITGRIIVLTPVETLTSRSGTAYQKREVVIERTVFDRNTGQPATDPNDTPIFRLIGAQAAGLDNMAVGDMVTVHYELEGRTYVKDGVKAYFNDVRVFRIEPAQKQPTAAPETPTGAVNNPAAYVAESTHNGIAVQPTADAGELPF